MIAYLVHHAHALSPQQDFERPLSPLGRRQAAWLAARARDHGCRPEAIWHSGKRRARETAEAFLRACRPSAEFRMVRGLRPEDPAEWMRRELEADTRDLLLAGHMPHLGELLGALCPDAEALPLHGLVALARDDDGGWSEAWRASPPADV